ncbi:aminoglycoside phosphotransferase family protein [Pseudonocardia sp. CA-107938]|uniref:aminoglycoside phosphotransferase family protein n=1 Tax=Pseudonocardia sp. CA-107938 TaxID=3240021 RepID=UPI003D8F0254
MARRSTVGPGLLGPGLVADDRRNDARRTGCLGRRSHARRRDAVSSQGRGSRTSTPTRLRSDRARSRCGEELRTPDPPRPHPRRTPAREARAGDARRDSDHRAQHDALCDIVARFWRPIDDDIDLPSGADFARRMQRLIPQLWEDLDRPCSAAVIGDAVECADRRERAHHRRTAVLVHGDVHEANALQAADGTFKLIDPDGLRAEPACDLGTIVRCTPAAGDDLRARTERLAARTGIDATAIWEWGTVHRVISGLSSVRIGFQPFGSLLLAEADRLAQTR